MALYGERGRKDVSHSQRIMCVKVSNLALRHNHSRVLLHLHRHFTTSGAFNLTNIGSGRAEGVK